MEKAPNQQVYITIPSLCQHTESVSAYQVCVSILSLCQHTSAYRHNKSVPPYKVFITIWKKHQTSKSISQFQVHITYQVCVIQSVSACKVHITTQSLCQHNKSVSPYQVCIMTLNVLWKFTISLTFLWRKFFAPGRTLHKVHIHTVLSRATLPMADDDQCYFATF